MNLLGEDALKMNLIRLLRVIVTEKLIRDRNRVRPIVKNGHIGEDDSGALGVYDLLSPVGISPESAHRSADTT